MATTTTQATEDTRTITALLAFTVAFALVGNEVKSGGKPGNPAAGSPDHISTAGRIIIGGTIGATLLILLSHAGEPGRKFSLGLATVTFVTTALVYGGPVWTLLANIVKNNPGGTPTGLTKSTTPTTPTQGTATVAAFAQAA